MDVFDGLHCGVPNVLTFCAHNVLGTGPQELKVFFKDVLNSQEHILESRFSHQRSKCFTVVRDGRSHPLNDIFDVVQTSSDNGLAQLFETMNIQRDVVIDQEDGLCAMLASVANIREHSIE